MDLKFELGPMRIVARYTPAVPGRRVGHPDRWTEREPEEIEIVSVDGVSDCVGEVTEAELEDAARDEARRVADDGIDAMAAWLEDR